MRFVPEVTARLENKPGRLAKISSALAHEKVEVLALSVMDSAAERSVLRLVTDNLETTRKILTSLGTEHEISEVLAVEIDSRPGALARVLEKLAEEHINIEYAYSAGVSSPGKALATFHTNNPKRAHQVLNDAVGNGGGNGHAPGRRPLHSR
ncbi:MAG: ACT domain-containing protein [Isosphaeraceae bacterium]